MDALVKAMMSDANPPEGGAVSPKAASPSRSSRALEMAWDASQKGDKNGFMKAIDAAIEMKVLALDADE